MARQSPACARAGIRADIFVRRQIQDAPLGKLGASSGEQGLPMDDPKALTSADWNNIHLFLQWFWIYFPLVVTFALTMLTAYAFIPSAVATGHLPPSASRLKLPLTAFALLVAAAAIVILILGINQTLDVRNFWDRLLI